MKSILLLFLVDEIRLPVEVYARVRGTSSPSRSFRDPVHFQRFSLLHFPMRSKAIFDEIQSYSVLDFPSTKPPLNSKWEICNASAILEVSGKLNLLMNLNRVPLIVLGFLIFIFPLIL